MSLSNLPQEHINQAFYQLSDQAVTPALQEICNYIFDTYLSNPMWSRSSWSAFMRSIRTNNDVDGWYFQLNGHARKGILPFYQLIQLLHDEAITTSIEVYLVSEKKLKHSQRKSYRKLKVTCLSYGSNTVQERRLPVSC